MVLAKVVSWRPRKRIGVHRVVLGVAFIVTIGFFGPRNAAAATTHYIAASGSDSNNGTSKTSAWAHLPGMASCSSSCNSYSPTPGDQFILRGGDTWVASDLPVDFNWNGTSSAPIYIGVDPTWFAGTSWRRPIFSCQNTQCGRPAQFNIGGSYVTLDNIEFTGLRFVSSTAKGVQTTSDHTEVENCYFHGWSHDSGFSASNDDGRGFALAANASGGGSAGVGVKFHNNVVDGQDTSQDMMGGADDSETVYNNVFRYVYNCIRGAHTYVYGNLCENIVSEGWPNADHANGISIFSPFSGSNMWVYNNVLRNGGLAPGSESFWLHSLGSASGENAYIYNNVMYNMGRGIDIGDHPPASGGTNWVYNNTIEASGDHCFGNGETGVRMVINYENNHCINSSSQCTTISATCNNLGGNLSQTTAQANAAGYTSSQTYAYSPTSISSPTYHAGNNISGSCSGNLAGLCNDTTYPTYDSVNHRPVMRTVVPRPSSGGWDIGAYQYSSSSGSVLNPPTGLSALVQ